MTELFRTDLSPAEIAAMKQWARKNYVPGTPIKSTWHPIVQRECVKMNERAQELDTFNAEFEKAARAFEADEGDR